MFPLIQAVLSKSQSRFFRIKDINLTCVFAFLYLRVLKIYSGVHVALKFLHHLLSCRALAFHGAFLNDTTVPLHRKYCICVLFVCICVYCIHVFACFAQIFLVFHAPALLHGERRKNDQCTFVLLKDLHFTLEKKNYVLHKSIAPKSVSIVY